MKYSLLGRTGVRVSKLCLGTFPFGVTPLEEGVPALVHHALDVGINFFDTSNSYGNQPRFDRPGAPPAAQRKSAEELLGKALKGHRHEVVISSKVQEKVGDGPNDGGPTGGGLTRYHIMRQVEESLRRLGTDHLDVYHMHHPDPTTPLEESLRAFDDLVKQGKILYPALSTFPAWQMTEAMGICKEMGWPAPVCNQLPYNLIRRNIEQETVPACLHFGLTINCFTPVAQGVLSDSTTMTRPYGGVRRMAGRTGPSFSPVEVAINERLNKLARDWGHSAVQLALSWLITRPAISAAIIGAETPEEIDADVPAADITLTSDQVKQLEAIVSADGGQPQAAAR